MSLSTRLKRLIRISLPLNKDANELITTIDALSAKESALLAMSGGQFNINPDTVIELKDNVSGLTFNDGVTFNNSTFKATLKAGKTYKLQAFLRHDGPASNTAANYRWFDVTNSSSLGVGNQISSIDSTSDDSFQPTATAIVAPSTDIDVQLRCTGVSVANQSLFPDASHATIETI